MYNSEQTKRSFMLLEVLSALVLIVMALGLFALGLTQFVNYSDVLLTRQAAVMAAEATINEIRAGGDVTPESLAERFPKMTFKISRTPGKDEWEGLECVSVEVRSVPKFRKEVKATVGGYMGRTEP